MVRYIGNNMKTLNVIRYCNGILIFKQSFVRTFLGLINKSLALITINFLFKDLTFSNKYN